MTEKTRHKGKGRGRKPSRPPRSISTNVGEVIRLAREDKRAQAAVAMKRVMGAHK